MFKEKRGAFDIQYTVIAEIILATIIFIALLSYVQGVASDSLFEQNFLARDVGLLIDSVYAAPGDLSKTYDVSIAENKLLFLPAITPETKLRFAFDNSRVFVFRGSSGDIYQKPASYYFGENQKLNFLYPEPSNIDNLDTEEGPQNAYSAPNTESNLLIIKEDAKISIDFTELQTDEFEEVEK